VLLQDDRFVGENNVILKPKVYEACMNMDSALLKLLLADEMLKSHFFADVDGMLVFDKIKFSWVLESREFLPDSYTLFRNKIGLADKNNNLLSSKNDVSLVWPYKDCVLEGGQTKDDQKRDEVFYNEILAPDEVSRLLHPKVFSNAKRYTPDGVEEIDRIDEDDNLIIKGNNLLALSSLLKRYEGKVKCIYIDPPYNTGSDSFKYNDSFNRSTWLTFMRNRLEIALGLVAKDGWIVVHVDDNEQAYLKILCDEIFGEENFVNNIAIRDSHASGLKLAHKEKTIIKTKSYMLVYRKSSLSKINPCYVEREDWDTHFNRIIVEDENGLKLQSLSDKFKREYNRQDFVVDKSSLRDGDFRSFIEHYKEVIVQSTKEIPLEIKEKSLQNRDKVIVYETSEGVRSYAYNGRRLSPLTRSFWNVSISDLPQEKFAKLICDFWEHIDFNNSQNEGGISFPAGKKPERLLGTILKMFTEQGDLVLDFFAGSASTQAVAHKTNRQYVGIEQMNYIEELLIPRLKNVIDGDSTGISKEVNWQGGGSFVYCELMEQNESLVTDLQNAETSEEIQEVLSKAMLGGALIPSVIPEELRSNMDGFVSLSLEEQRRLVMELIDKNRLYINLCDMDDEDMAVTEKDKAFTRSFYGLDKGDN
ncbi:MAG: site-specific DNA-methyltransferase, partial [Epulopiscium sp.]|nr:site-specific DNA-methyltransferase [Candidatus Epulonipiscium sp.]